MAKYTNAYVIPAVGPVPGGVLYDKYGNFSYFADVSSLVDKTQTPTDLVISRSGAQVEYYMRSKGKFSRAGGDAYRTVGIQLTKGAIPGVTVRLVSGAETRQFQYEGNLSSLYNWIKNNANVDVDMYGPSGTPYVEIPAT